MTLFKTTQKIWTDEAGLKLPIARITQMEKKREQVANKLLTKAEKLHKQLADFKREAFDLLDDLYLQMLKENDIDGSDRKGNYTLFSFDRSVKAELSINDSIAFDDMLIKAAQEKLNEFLNLAIGDKQQFIRDIIRDAFQTSRGKLDTRKVMNLLKYRTKIVGKEEKQLYNEAMNLIEKSIRRPDSRKYVRIWIKDDNGEYQNIDLNFSSIQPSPARPV